MPRCFVALGGNVGTVEQTFEQACHQLNTFPGVRLGPISSTFRFTAVGEQAGDEFLNAALEIETDLQPLELLERLQEVETSLGRTREKHWGPRTLDLDLLLYGNEVINSSRLRVPHPAMWYRRFVLDPLAEIAADVVHPERQVPIQKLHQQLLKRPFRVCVAGGIPRVTSSLIKTLQSQFPPIEFVSWETGELEENLASAIIIWLGQAGPDPEKTVDFAALPPYSRLDASALQTDRTRFLIDVLQAAMGE